MPETSSSTADQVHEHHDEPKRRWRFIVLFAWMPVHKSAIMLVLSWLAPFIIMAIGYFFFPALREPVTWPWRSPVQVWAGVALQLVLTLIWLLYEIWYTVHRNTGIRELQVDHAGDLVGSFLLVWVLGGSINEGTLEWWFLVPFVGALIDVFQSGLLAINNAAEKPFVSPKGST